MINFILKSHKGAISCIKYPISVYQVLESETELFSIHYQVFGR